MKIVPSTHEQLFFKKKSEEYSSIDSFREQGIFIFRHSKHSQWVTFRVTLCVLSMTEKSVFLQTKNKLAINSPSIFDKEYFNLSTGRVDIISKTLLIKFLKFSWLP